MYDRGGGKVLKTGTMTTEVGNIWYAIDESGVKAISAPGRGRDDWQQVLRRSGLDLGSAAEDESDCLGVRRQLAEYMRGERQTFSLPLSFSGTPFQLSVWKALQEIPYGEVRSYAAIAREIGSPQAARAVGQANNRNPLAIVIPCHRVVASDSTLGGYAGGLASKEFLLRLEQRWRG